MKYSDLTRREFMFVLTGVLGSLVFTSANLLATDEATLALSQAIGESYLKQFGQEPEIDNLKSKLEGSVNSVLNQKALLESLRQKIGKDFLVDRTFQYDRWVLSRTEGRLCAIAYLEAVVS